MAATTSDILTYPEVRRDEDVLDILHGTPVKDPYRWLENPDSEETKAFVDAQNEVTRRYFSKFADQRNENLEKLRNYQNYERVSCPFKRGEEHFMFRNTGLQNQDVLYRVRMSDDFKAAPDGLFDSADAILNLNEEYPDGTTSLGSWQFSKNGKYLAYGLQHAGSDWQTIWILDVKSKEKLPQRLEWAKFTSIAWVGDRGFYYTRYPAPTTTDAGTETSSNENASIWYHSIDGSVDKQVYADPEHPTWRFGVEVSEDEQYLVTSVYKGTDPVNQIYIAALDGVNPESVTLRVLAGTFDAQYELITHRGGLLYFRTNLDAATYRIVTSRVTDNALPIVSKDVLDANVTPVITEAISAVDQQVLDWAAMCADDTLLLCYISHATNILKQVNIAALPCAQSDIASVELPAGVTIVSAAIREHHRVNYLKLTSPVMPGDIFRLESDSTVQNTQKAQKWYGITVPGFCSEDFLVEQHFVLTADSSASLPIFVVRHKRTVGAGPQPTLLYSYGGFNVSLQPTFSAVRLLWISHFGGTYVLACLRGGGEYGEAWHQAGCRLRKQNCFDDLKSCASHVIASGLTSAGQLAIMGGSNGGLGVLATALQSPGLFAAVVSQVPVADMLRFHKFTIGAAWRGEYGYVEDDPEDFNNVMKYSPLHNVPQDGPTLPSILITTGDHDDRVVPLHTHKMIATLQHCRPRNAKPLLVRIETSAGHGAGKPTNKVLEEYADIFTFLLHECTRNTKF